MSINETQMGLVNKLLETVAGLLQPYLKLDADISQIEQTIKDEIYDGALEAVEVQMSALFDDMFSDSMTENGVITNDTIGDWVQSEDDIGDICSDRIRLVLAHDVSVRLEVD